jgi:DNA-binding MarR family transcriptional regulator
MRRTDLSDNTSASASANDYEALAPEDVLGLYDLDSVVADVAQTFRKATLLHSRAFKRRLAQKGSYPEEALCFRLLAFEEGVSQRTLAKLMQRSPQAISKMLDALESAGFVTRQPDNEDRRVMRAYLTLSGRTREAELAAVYSDFIKQTMGGLSEADQLEFGRLLNLFVGCLSRVVDVPDLSQEEVHELTR